MTDAEYQDLIITELGLSLDTVATTNIEAWWSFFSAQGTSVSKYCQYLYTKRTVIFYLVGKYASKYDVQIGFDIFSKSQVFKNYALLLKMLNDELALLDPLSLVPALQMSSPASALPPMGSAVYTWLEHFHFGIRNGTGVFGGVTRGSS